jgi:hypothetical protein
MAVNRDTNQQKRRCRVLAGKGFPDSKYKR